MPTTYRILHASDLHLSEVPYMVRNLQLAEGREKHPHWWQQAQNALLAGHDEDVLEAFYALQISRGIFVTLDFQEFWNPAYNQDRGPLWIPSIRLHVELGKNTFTQRDKH